MSAESLFLRFRDRREPAALGAVFDLVADELFAVALHLGRDTADAEDLVQATFLVAIERARRWDSARPLRPWLLGILHQEANTRRRRARRTPDPERLSPVAEPPPVQTVAARETADAVARAIADVPQPYRDVLELRLVQSLPAGEIATRLRRSPGAVRTQLWRGLEMLRPLLPKGLAVGLAAELSSQPALAAVRQRIVEAAGTKIGVGSTSVLAGALVMQKLWIGVAAVVVLAAGWSFWPRPAADPADAMANALPVAAAASLETPDAAPVPVSDREAVRATAETAAESAAVAAPVAPVTARLLVVDNHGDPVADAEVELHEALPPKANNGGSGRSPGRRDGPALAVTRTDTAGRAALTIGRECFVAVRKPGIGASGDVRLSPEMHKLRDELRVPLLAVHHILGTVLLPTGSPAADTLVRCYKPKFLSGHLAESLPDATTDATGQFTFEVLQGLEYRLTASRDGRWVKASVDTSRAGPEHSLTLQFPGAYSVRGLLLDSEGQPTAGEIRLLSTPAPAGAQPKYRRAKADEDGRFELLLTEGGTFELVGGVEGQTAAHVPIAVTESRPHGQATLRLTPFVVVAGRAVDERGEPCAGVHVGLSPICERDGLYQCRTDLQGIYPRGPTAADGTFHFLAPAGDRYRVGYRPAPRLYAYGPEVTPPAADVVLVVREADKRGFTVTGRAVAEATGAVVPAYRVFLVEHEEDGGFRDAPVANATDSTFAIGPLPTGRRYSLRFEAEGYGTATTGPFDATVREEKLVARLPALCRLVCTVLRPDGRPAVEAHVGLQHVPRQPFARAHQGDTDGEGRIELDDLTPGEYTVYATAEITSGGTAKGSVTILPEQRATIVLTLQQ